MIRSIVFDIGSVLVSFNYSDFLRELGYSEKIRQELDVIPEGSAFWARMDRGLETEREALGNYLELVPTYKKEAEYAFMNMAYYMEEIRETSAFLRSAKEEGYRVYYLSNYPRRNWEIINRRFPFFRLFNGGVVSYEVCQVKPEPAIFHTLMQRCDLRPEETLFIDDREKNTAAARSLGFVAVTLKEGMDLPAIAREYGVEVAL